MSNVIIYPESLCASVIGKELSAKTPTELYVAVMAEILKNYPQIIGQKETHFTTDQVRAEKYTGKTRSVDIAGRTVYILTGLATKAKWQAIEKTCQLAGLTFEVSYEEPSESVSDIFGLDDDFFADFGVSPNPFQETSSTEPFVPTSPFAFHSEYYINERTLGWGDSHISCAKFDDMVYCDGRIYATEECIYGYRFLGSNTVFEILPNDWSIRAIVSQNKYFIGDIAVNKNGIFRIDGNKFYLFDMNGKIKSKVTIKPTRPSGMYIYDSKIYSLSAKGKIYEYDILNPNSEKVIWNISDIRGRLDDAVASYLLDNNLERRYNNQRIQISIPWLTPKRICANDKRIVVGFELDLSSKQLCVSRNKFMLYVSIDTQNYKWNIIDVSDTRADYKVFSFDMEKDIMWWWTGDNKSRYLFSTEIKPLDSAVRKNPQYSYHLFGDFYDGYSSLSYFLSCNSYFDGKSASGNTNMDTVYLCADGTSERHFTSSQCFASYVLGDFMYRPNMCGGFVPHSKEAFVNYSSWHKITLEEFERAYQKAVSK